MENINYKNLNKMIEYVEENLTNEINIKELAKIVGVTRQTINLIELGNYNPTLNLCISICKALNKTLNDLFWKEEMEGE